MFDEDDELDESAVMSPREIYEKLMEVGELILTIPEDDLDKLKQGVTTAKNKANNRLKEAGMPVDKKVLSFVAYPSKAEDVEDGALDVHIVLAQRPGIRILNVQLPDGEL